MIILLISPAAEIESVFKRAVKEDLSVFQAYRPDKARLNAAVLSYKRGMHGAA